MTVHMESAGGGDSFVPAQPGPYANAANFPGPYETVPVSPQVATGVEVDPYEGYVDYFNPAEQRERWYFPDGKQWIEYKKLSEGDRARFLKDNRNDVHLNRKTDEARVSFDQSGERKSLLLNSITNWHLVAFNRGRNTWEPVPFPSNRTPGGELAKWIDRQDPALLGSLEKEIRKVNPWLLNEMTVEAIDKEIADLQELRVAAEKREAEEKNSSSR